MAAIGRIRSMLGAAFLLGVVFSGPIICDDITPLVKITLNTTNAIVCTKVDSFKTSLYRLFVSRRSVVIDKYRFVYPTLADVCASAGNGSAVVSVYISSKSPGNATVDQEKTERLSQLIKKGDAIDDVFEVLSVEYIRDSSSRQIFSTSVVVAMIVVVCVVYLIGFALIVLTQSEGDHSKGPEVSYVISTDNRGYKRQVTPSNKRR